MKKFNTTGICLQKKNYMCDVTKKFNRCKQLVEDGEYYAINFPRQHGKTTMQSLLRREFIKYDDYLVIATSFEGIGDTAFETEENLSSSVLEVLAKAFRITDRKLAKYLNDESKKIANFKDLSNFISDWIFELDKKVILIIDEVDKASNNQVFVSFLAMLRDKYLEAQDGRDITFHSVVLLGVHDVKALKLKIREDDEKKLNSPWNIAKALNVEFTFTKDEIEPMIEDYASEHEFKMDTGAIAEKLFYYTSGNPFLVSLMCEVIDETFMGEKKEAWKVQDVENSYKYLIDGAYTTTNFDDVDKNLENNEDLFNLVYNIIVLGLDYRFTVGDPVIAKGKTYGILTKNPKGYCDVSNKIYEFRILDYMLSKQKTKEAKLNLYTTSKFVKNGNLDIVMILEHFQLFMKEHHSSKDNDFLEKEGRLLLMSFFRPILNGKGFLFKENVTAEDRKMDLVITYNDKRYVIELKIWRGKKSLTDGIEQLCDYLDHYSLNEGAMLIYNFNKDKKYETRKVEGIKKKITAVFV